MATIRRMVIAKFPEANVLCRSAPVFLKNALSAPQRPVLGDGANIIHDYSSSIAWYFPVSSSAVPQILCEA